MIAAKDYNIARFRLGKQSKSYFNDELHELEDEFRHAIDVLETYEFELKNSQKLLSIPPLINSGNHSVIIDCLFGGEEPPKIEMQFKGISKVETCSLKK